VSIAALRGDRSVIDAWPRLGPVPAQMNRIDDEVISVVGTDASGRDVHGLRTVFRLDSLETSVASGTSVALSGEPIFDRTLSMTAAGLSTSLEVPYFGMEIRPAAPAGPGDSCGQAGTCSIFVLALFLRKRA
jgi:hypothetical protein